MAKPATENERKASGGISILAVIIFSLLAAGSGVGFGFLVPGLIKDKPAAQTNDAAADDKHGVSIATRLMPLAPLTTNLAEPKSTWVRIEASIVGTENLGPDADIMTRKMSEDIIGYFRTVSLDQIEGPSGFQHLREDLNDRVRVRSEGKVSELIITSLIVE